jgi:acyl carrier protein
MEPELVISRVFGVRPSDVSDETRNADVEAWDSLGHMTLVVELESEYGVSFSADEVLQMTSVGAIKRVLGERGVAW